MLCFSLFPATPSLREILNCDVDVLLENPTKNRSISTWSCSRRTSSFVSIIPTHLRSSSTAISCLTWWNSLAILQCSLYTWTLSFSDPQGGTGCSREERRGCQLDTKYRETLLLKKENKKPNCHIQQLWSWICELHFHWICFCRCTRLSSLMLASLTCLLISLMVIMVLFHNTIGLSLENIWSGIRTAAIVPCQLKPKVLHFFQVITLSPWTLYIKWYMTKWYCTWCDPEWLKGNSTQHRAVNSQNIDL